MSTNITTDPDRPFVLALRSTRLLGIVSTAFGLMMLIVFGYFNRLVQFRMHFKLLASLVWVLPGVAFVVAAIMMKERRRWSVVLAIGAAVVQLIFALALFVANFIFSPISPVPVVLTALWIAALIQLLTHLKLSLRSLNLMPGAQIHGFEMIPSPPVPAIPIDPPSIQSSESDRGK